MAQSNLKTAIILIRTVFFFTRTFPIAKVLWLLALYHCLWRSFTAPPLLVDCCSSTAAIDAVVPPPLTSLLVGCWASTTAVDALIPPPLLLKYRHHCWLIVGLVPPPLLLKYRRHCWLIVGLVPPPLLLKYLRHCWLIVGLVPPPLTPLYRCYWHSYIAAAIVAQVPLTPPPLTPLMFLYSRCHCCSSTSYTTAIVGWLLGKYRHHWRHCTATIDAIDTILPPPL